MTKTPPTPRRRTETSPSGRAAEIARWERQRARGRTDFIVRRGVIGWGFPIAILTVAYKVVQEQGFVLSPVLTDNVRTAIVIAFIVFPLCGWLFGGWLWRTGEDRYHMLVRERDGTPG